MPKQTTQNEYDDGGNMASLGTKFSVRVPIEAGSHLGQILDHAAVHERDCVLDDSMRKTAREWMTKQRDLDYAEYVAHLPKLDRRSARFANAVMVGYAIVYVLLVLSVIGGFLWTASEVVSLWH